MENEVFLLCIKVYPNFIRRDFFEEERARDEKDLIKKKKRQKKQDERAKKQRRDSRDFTRDNTTHEETRDTFLRENKRNFLLLFRNALLF